MKKIFLAVVLAPLLNTAQLYPYAWRVGVHGGFSTYYGDLTPYRLRGDGVGRVLGHLYTFNQEYFPAASWQVSAERSLNPTLSLKMTFGNFNFSANDRFVKPDGTLWTEAPLFNRGLNAQTSIYDGSIGLIFKTDNFRFLSQRSLLAPYFGIHLVALSFETFGDLLDSEGSFYNLSDPNLRQEGIYETLLTGLKTEGVDYSTFSFGGRLELGIRLRLSRQLDLNISTQYTLTATDYLDDISGEYPTQFTSTLQQRASDPTDRRFTTSQRGDNLFSDSYLFHSVGIQWSFGSKRRLRKFPTIGGFAPPPGTENRPSVFDPAIRQLTQSATTVEDSLLFLIQSQREDIDELRIKLYRAINRLQIVEGRIRAASLTAEASNIESQITTAVDSVQYLKQMLNELHLDTILPKSVRDSMSVNIFQRQKLLERQRDSLTTLLQSIRSESDSLSLWVEVSEKTLAQIPQTVAVKTASAPATLTSPKIQMQPLPLPEGDNDDATTEELQNTTPSFEQPAEKKATTSRAEPSTLPDEPTSERPKTQGTPQSTSAPAITQPTTASPNQQKTISTAPASPSRELNKSASPGTAVASKPAVSVSSSIKTVQAPSSPPDTNQNSDIVRILEQQTRILQLLTEQITARQSHPKADTIQEGKSDSIFIAASPPALLDSIKKQPEATLTENRVPFSTIAGFKTRSAVYFQSGKTSLDSAEELHLRDIAKYLADSTSSFILLRGYADNTGSPSKNFQIIGKRLEYVRAILIQEGVSPGRIRVENGGIIVKKTPSPQPLDRRVELIVLSTD